MTKIKASLVALRLAEEDQNKVEELIEYFNNTLDMKVDKSKVMRKAIIDYVDLHKQEAHEKGEVFIQRFNQERYKFPALFDAIYDIQELAKNESNEQKAYLFNMLKNLLGDVLEYEIQKGHDKNHKIGEIKNLDRIIKRGTK
jgi:ferritin